MLAQTKSLRWFVMRALPDSLRLGVLNRFHVSDRDGAMPLPRSAQRLLAFLALHPRGMSRDFVAGTLWPDVPEARAHASLRSALKRTGCAARLVESEGSHLALRQTVRVDLQAAKACAGGLLDDSRALTADEAASAVRVLECDLLPGWYDDWVLEEAEVWRQLRLHALEALATSLAHRGRFGQALAVAGVAITADPLRETARAAMIRVHLAEGNRSEAIRTFERYSLLAIHAGLEPTATLRQLVYG